MDTTGCSLHKKNTKTDGTSKRMLYRSRRRVRWLDLLGLAHTKEQAVKWRIQALGSLSLVGLVLTIYYLGLSDSHAYNTDTFGASRHLLSTETNVTFHGPSWEKCDFEKENIKYAWLVNHAVCIIFIFIAIAIVCDDFFVPSLEVISEKMNLSEDVAGATFMAAGSSAPELFTSVAGVAVQTDVGVGTIVGSAVFNLLIIIALTGALAGQVLDLDWRPLCRDAFFYAMSIGCFIGFAWDGYFQHYESVILLCLYIIYIILMVFNPRLMDWMDTWKCCCKTPGTVSPSNEEEAPELATEESNMSHSNPKLKDQANNLNHAPSVERRLSLTGGHARRISLIQRTHSGDIAEKDRHIFHHHQRGSIVGVLATVPKPKSMHVTQPIVEEDEPSSREKSEEKENEKEKEENKEEEEEDDDFTGIQLCPCLPCCPTIRSEPPGLEEIRSTGGCMSYFKFILRWFMYIPAFPFICAFSWTIPDCSKEHNKKWFLASFLTSVLWIAILSFGMVTLVGRAGCILGIDTYIMGLVIVAIGTSIPDALSSIIVARDGYGDMAVSNAIGSNVFDINLGLGLPFIIRIAIDKGAPISLLGDSEWVDYYNGTMTVVPHAKFGFILLIILAIALFVFVLSRFRLNKYMGIVFVIIYVLFLVYAFTQELYCVRTLETYC